MDVLGDLAMAERGISEEETTLTLVAVGADRAEHTDLVEEVSIVVEDSQIMLEVRIVEVTKDRYGRHDRMISAAWPWIQ
jgi:Flp pilus assembly secretin CpaC